MSTFISRVHVNYVYNVDKSEISEKVGIYDETLERENARIEEISKIKEYLEKK